LQSQGTPEKSRESNGDRDAAAVSSDWLRQLHFENAESYEQAQRSGKYCSRMFTFTRGVRLKLALASEEEAIKAIDHALRSWDESIQDPWRHWFPASPDPVTEFRETWRKLRTNTLQIALRRAEALPLKPRIHNSNRSYVRFLSIAFHLQIERGTDPILLPCDRIGRLLAAAPVDRKVVWRYRVFACELGLLVLTKKSTGRNEADEFRFLVEFFDRESGEQLSGATQSCVALATHEIPGSGSINKILTQESHEKSCVAPAVKDSPKKKPASEPYIPSGAETAVILQQHWQRYYGQKA
jgi:hypothetical protein